VDWKVGVGARVRLRALLIKPRVEIGRHGRLFGNPFLNGRPAADSANLVGSDHHRSQRSTAPRSNGRREMGNSTTEITSIVMTVVASGPIALAIFTISPFTSNGNSATNIVRAAQYPMDEREKVQSQTR